MVAFGAIEGPVGALRQLSTTPYREGAPLRVVGCFAAPYQGLSPVRGNSPAAAKPAPYPTVRVRNVVSPTVPTRIVEGRP